MKKFDNSANRAVRRKALDGLDKKTLAEKVNPNYPEGLKEIAGLLTFLPEESREAAVRSLVRAVLLS
jgi:hypothetical protein